MRTIVGQRLTKLAVRTVRNSGQFKKGNNKGKGGRKPGAGRPTKHQQEAKLQVLDQLRLECPEDLKALNKLRDDPRTTPELKAKILMWKMNKTVPDLKEHEHKGGININFPDLVLNTLDSLNADGRISILNN